MKTEDDLTPEEELKIAKLLEKMIDLKWWQLLDKWRLGQKILEINPNFYNED